MGDHFQVLKVSEGTCTFRGVGDLFQVLEVHVTYMYGAVYEESIYYLVYCFLYMCYGYYM